MIKLIYRTLYLLAFLILSYVGYFFSFTTSGLQLIIACVALALPGKITIGQIDGTLFSAFSLKSITYQDKGEIIHINSLALTWDPKKLLTGKLIIDQLQLGTTQIQILDNTSSSFDMRELKWPIFLNIKELDLEKIELLVAKSKIFIHGSINEKWNIRWDAKIANISDILPNSLGEFYSSGTINGDLFTPEITANLDINRFKLEDTSIDHAHGIAKISLRSNAKSSFILDAQGLKVADYTFKKIKATANGDFKFEDHLFKTNTYITIDPLYIPQLGITLTNLSLHNITESHKPWYLSGTVSSGNGSAQIKGKIDIKQAFISLRGNDLLVANLDNYKIHATPNLTLTFNNPNISLKGTLTIPEARITSSDFGKSISLPDEVVYEDKPNNAIKNPLANLDMQVNIILGDKIFLQYEDLQADLSGKLQISQQPGRPMLATGELYAIKGTYHTYGQTLTLHQSRLVYAGNLLLNPGLNIRAAREIKTVAVSNNTSSFSNSSIAQPIYTGSETVTVGVQIQGTADHPVTSLYSTPTMPQKDVLSYLLFGYPQSQAGANQLSTLLSATSALNSKGKLPSIGTLTHGIQEKLGLTELTVGPTEMFDPNKGTAIATTSVMVGKQIAKNLYMHYSVSLFNPISILNVRYQLGKRWAIQSETSRIDSGADLLYGIERD